MLLQPCSCIFVALNMLFPRQLLASSIAVKFNCKKRQKTGFPWQGEGGECQNRLIVLLLHGYFNKSILMFFINNNLIKKTKYSISFLFS